MRLMVWQAPLWMKRAPIRRAKSGLPEFRLECISDEPDPVLNRDARNVNRAVPEPGVDLHHVLAEPVCRLKAHLSLLVEGVDVCPAGKVEHGRIVPVGFRGAFI